MNAKYLKLALILLLAVAILIACQPQVVTQMVEVTRTITEAQVLEGEEVVVTQVVYEVAESAGSPDAIAAAATPLPTSAAIPVLPQQRMIIKDGRMVIVAQETETAVNRVSQLVVEVGGYLVSQQVYDDDQGYRYATMRLAVPVDRFEETLRTLRTLGQVTDETTSGVDVTDEFVDLNSRLENLEATQQRLLAFLEGATTPEQSLKVNEELKTVEEEIAVIQGRVNYLRDRSAFSTIDLTINPWIPTPTITPTPTNTPTPTPTPLPQARDWRPGETMYVASVQLQNTAQETTDSALYTLIAFGPWLFMLLLVGYPLWKTWQRFV